MLSQYSILFQLPALIVLREAGVSVDITTVKFQQTAAHIAAFAGADHCLKYLVHFGCNVNKQVCWMVKTFNPAVKYIILQLFHIGKHNFKEPCHLPLKC